MQNDFKLHKFAIEQSPMGAVQRVIVVITIRFFHLNFFECLLSDFT